MQKIKALTVNLHEKLFMLFVYGVCVFIASALLFQLFFVALHVTGQDQYIQELVNRFDHRFDGNFKNDPQNVMYDADEHIWVESVTNNVKIGKLAGNRNLEFGIRNILEEFLQEKDYDINPESKSKVSVEIVYLDVLKTKSNIFVHCIRRGEKSFAHLSFAIT